VKNCFICNKMILDCLSHSNYNDTYQAGKEIVMEKSIKQWAQSLFDSIQRTDEHGVPYWYARELGEALEYSSWENFEKVVTKAKVSVSEAGMAVENHFHDVMKMVAIGYGNDRAVNDVKLTRYACYIIAQNGNAAKKPKIAAAQSYFAIQTRKQELAEERDYDIERLIARQKFTESDKRVSEAVLEKGISGRGLGRIKSSGDQSMFGGKTTSQMKQQYGITNPRVPLANRAPNVVLAAKSLANEMTATNLASYAIDGFDAIRSENDDNNSEVRKALVERGIVPEKLQAEEDTDVIMRRLASEDKKRAIES
jgi:DNA-damage-inducible protein D